MDFELSAAIIKYTRLRRVLVNMEWFVYAYHVHWNENVGFCTRELEHTKQLLLCLLLLVSNQRVVFGSKRMTTAVDVTI